MDPLIKAIITLVVGLGILLVGFKLLSDNIEKLANTGLKKLFSKKSKNYIVEVGIGAIATALIHSSAASTVMIVGFVNAGIMNLYQATAMIMGANIGTTITAQIVALGGVGNFTTYAMLFATIGMVMQMFCKQDKMKSLGLALAGMGLVFVALGQMSLSMETFSLPEYGLQDYLASINNPFVLLLTGIVITALIQSSTAVTTIIISMAATGIYVGGKDSNGILFVILGSNIGTCVTALLSSIGAKTNAKRASLIHLLFNVSGAILFFIVLVLWPSFMKDTFASWFVVPTTQIAMFHTFFNLLCTILFMPLITLIVKTVETLIKDDKKSNMEVSYIDDRLLKSPTVALEQAKNEIVRIGGLSIDTLTLAVDAFLEKSIEKTNDVNENIKELDTLNENILSYLVKVSAQQISEKDENLVSKLHNMVNDFYREVEIADNMIKYTKTTINQNLKFSQPVYDEIKSIKEFLSKEYEILKDMIINKEYEKISSLDEIEEIIDNKRTTMIAGHIERLEKNECSPANSGVFINLVSNLERAGDHLNYIAHEYIENK